MSGRRLEAIFVRVPHFYQGPLLFVDEVYRMQSAYIFKMIVNMGLDFSFENSSPNFWFISFEHFATFGSDKNHRTQSATQHVVKVYSMINAVTPEMTWFHHTQFYCVRSLAHKGNRKRLILKQRFFYSPSRQPLPMIDAKKRMLPREFYERFNKAIRGARKRKM